MIDWTPAQWANERYAAEDDDKFDREAAAYKESRGFDFVGAIMDYEAGDLEECDVLTLFQYLVDTGLAWQLQGSYGRTAADLIEQGWVTA